MSPPLFVPVGVPLLGAGEDVTGLAAGRALPLQEDGRALVVQVHPHPVSDPKVVEGRALVGQPHAGLGAGRAFRALQLGVLEHLDGTELEAPESLVQRQRHALGHSDIEAEAGPREVADNVGAALPLDHQGLDPLHRCPGAFRAKLTARPGPAKTRLGEVVVGGIGIRQLPNLHRGRNGSKPNSFTRISRIRTTSSTSGSPLIAPISSLNRELYRPPPAPRWIWRCSSYGICQMFRAPARPRTNGLSFRSGYGSPPAIAVARSPSDLPIRRYASSQRSACPSPRSGSFR